MKGRAYIQDSAAPAMARPFISPAFLPRNTLQKQPTTQPTTPRTFPFTSQEQSFGRFDVRYTPVGPDPDVGTVLVTMKVHYNFSADFTDAEKTQYASDFENEVESTWSNQHRLALNDPNMDTHFANVQIDVETVDDAADAHFEMHVAKNRPDEFRSNVSGTDVHLDENDPTSNESFGLTSADLFVRVGNFGFDSAAINTDVQQDLDEITQFLNAQPANVRQGNHTNGPIMMALTGRASSDGNKAYNERLSQRRIDTVSQHISSAVPDAALFEMSSPDGEKGTSTDASFRRVDVNIDLPQTHEPETANQNTAAHEAGHMFGLGDEYIEVEEGRFQGDANENDALVREIVDNAAAEEMRIASDSSIMSHGMDVLRGHYMPFAAALRRVSNNDHWTVE